MRQIHWVAVALAVAGSIAGTPARADTVIDAVDFLVDGKEMVGRHVTVTGCELSNAGDTVVFCHVRSGGHGAGDIVLDSSTMRREDLRRALRNCTEVLPKGDCPVREVSGRVGRTRGGLVVINNAKVGWQ